MTRTRRLLASAALAASIVLLAALRRAQGSGAAGAAVAAGATGPSGATGPTARRARSATLSRLPHRPAAPRTATRSSPRRRRAAVPRHDRRCRSVRARGAQRDGGELRAPSRPPGFGDVGHLAARRRHLHLQPRGHGAARAGRVPRARARALDRPPPPRAAPRRRCSRRSACSRCCSRTSRSGDRHAAPAQAPATSLWNVVVRNVGTAAAGPFQVVAERRRHRARAGHGAGPRRGRRAGRAVQRARAARAGATLVATADSANALAEPADPDRTRTVACAA